MSKIYLRLKENISVLVADGDWSLHTDDIIVLKKIGTKTEIKRNEYKPNEYIHNDSYLLIGFEYKTIKDMRKAFIDRIIEYHMVWNKCNSVDTLITLASGPPYYNSKGFTYTQILSNKKLDLELIKNFKYDDIFEDVSVTYNRENKLKKILQ